MKRSDIKLVGENKRQKTSVGEIRKKLIVNVRLPKKLAVVPIPVMIRAPAMTQVVLAMTLGPLTLVVASVVVIRVVVALLLTGKSG